MPKEPQDQHVFHHYDNDGPRVNVKAEKNTKGWNYEATVTGAVNVEVAMEILNEAVQALHKRFDPPDPEPEPAPATPEDESKAEETLRVDADPICKNSGLHKSNCACPDCVPF